MNERIKELAEQAWDTTAVSPDFGHPISFAEKFAELLVMDCMSICEELGDKGLDGHYCADEIKRHFGVKV